MYSSRQVYFKLGIALVTTLLLLPLWISISFADGNTPILVVVNDSYGANRFGRYLGEILRAEGLNSFDIVTINSLTAGDLSGHTLTILAETTLSPSQAALLVNYVAGGGRLLAMRPDAQLNSVLGVSKVGTTTNGYIAINSGVASNAGFTTVTLPYYGVADRYDLAGGATTIAGLYSGPSTATGYPAVVRYGSTVTWSYDLARSVIYSRQGNPANAGVDRDGLPPIRTTDVFYNAINLDRVSLPHADIQMRLFSRLISELLASQTPLPRLWYFPQNKRTMMIVTSDSHGQPSATFEEMMDAVEAVGGHITFYSSRFSCCPSALEANQWRLQGHELGMHPYAFQDGQTLEQGFEAAENYFTSKGYGAPSRTVRTHQVEWEGWADAAQVEAAHNIGLDTSFYTWGPSVMYGGDRFNQAHGYITGSALPMKFIDEQGNLIPVYQQVTALIDEQLIEDEYSQNLSSTAALAVSKQLIDASQAGDYAAIMSQFHADYYTFGAVQPWVDGTLAYAHSLNIPLWSAEQWLKFTETRHNANYGNVNWNNTTKVLSFTLTVTTTTGVSLTTTLPLSYNSNPLQAVTVDGSPTAYTSQSVTGLNMAFVTVPAGNHNFVAFYSQVPGVSLTQTSGSTLVSESGLTDTYRLVLTSQPTNPVQINFNPNLAQLNSIAPIVFTSLNWSTPQTVTVSAVDDLLAEGSHISQISHTVTSSDPAYNGLSVSSVNVTITDNDFPGVTFTETGGQSIVSEAGLTDTYRLVLTSQPTATVQINFSTGSQLAPIASVTFTTLNWNTVQTVTVTAINDLVAEGTHTGVIAHTASSSDPAYNGLTISSINVSITDNDIAGVGFTETGGQSIVSEAGLTDTYRLVLTSQPTATVQINFSTGSQLAPIVSVTFTTLNWNTAQTVTVTAINDLVAEGTHTGVIAHTASSSDPAYNGLTISSINVSITDNDVAGVGFTETGGQSIVSEAGLTDTYRLVLTSQPTATVQINFSTGSQLAPIASVTFTTLNWNTAQTVTISAIDDALAEGLHSAIIHHTATSLDSDYNGISIIDLTVDINDNDVAGMSIAPTLINVAEGGLQATYAISLTSQPTATVTITLTTDGQTTANPTVLNFNQLSWSLPQTVTVMAVDDSAVEGGHTSVISHTAVSTDSHYSGVSLGHVTANITDNDISLINITPTTLNLVEGGLSNTYHVVLNSQPASVVTVTITTDSQITAAPLSLQFTSLNWAVSRTVTVTAINDLIAEGSHIGIIHHTATSSDSNYNGVSINNVAANITDNDAAGVNIAPTALSIGEGGITATYTISLTSQPTAGVTINLNPDGQVNTNPVNLNFTTLNWNIPRKVTVTAVNDSVVEGVHIGMISHTVASTDPHYNGLALAKVTATITDNDHVKHILYLPLILGKVGQATR